MPVGFFDCEVDDKCDVVPIGNTSGTANSGFAVADMQSLSMTTRADGEEVNTCSGACELTCDLTTLDRLFVRTWEGKMGGVAFAGVSRWKCG